MKRRTFAKLVGAAAALRAGRILAVPQSAPATTPPPYRSPSPYDLGTRAQLFVDRVLVRQSERVSFTLHPASKHPKNPFVTVDRPWEGGALRSTGT